MPSLFLTLRYIAFALFIIFSSVICILSAVNLGSLQPDTASFPQIDALLIFTGGFGLVVIFPVIFTELVRKNAFISRVIVEISWLTVLWLLNISGAAALTSVSGQLHCTPNGAQSSTACTSSLVLLAFSWLNTLAMLVYLLAIVGSATYHSQDNNKIWHAGVRDFKWFSKQKQTTKQMSPTSEPSFFYGRLIDPANRARPAVPPIYAQQMGLTKDYRIEPLNEPVRIPNLPQIATPSNADLPTIPPAVTSYLSRIGSYNSRITSSGMSRPPIMLRAHTVPSLYPEHLQSATAPVNPPVPTDGEHPPPPAGYWPRKNPQEPLRPKHSKRRQNAQSTDDTNGGQLDPRSRPTGPRTVAPRPRPPTLEITSFQSERR